MEWSVLLPMMLASAGTGLTCGLSCGVCGTPIVNIFLASYLFTHAGKMKRSLSAFCGFHIGKMITVALLCMLISWFGNQIVDESGTLWGVNLRVIVYVVMLFFVLSLIVNWFRCNLTGNSKCHCDGCSESLTKRCSNFSNMLIYGLISGLSPCASLVIVLGYASALTVVESVIVGVCFSLANSVVPLLLLVALTGVLSKEMFREIPGKIKYFQLATYIIFMIALTENLISTCIGR